MKYKKDLVVGAIMVALGVIMIFFCMQIKVSKGSTDPGSRVFPLGASILLTVCGAGTMFTSWKSQNKAFLDAAGWKKLILAFVIMIVYALALKYLGFLISTPFFLFAFITLLADGQKVSSVARLLYSVVGTGLTWYVFEKLLVMQLPAGLLF